MTFSSLLKLTVSSLNRCYFQGSLHLDIIQNGPNTSNILDLGFGIIGFLGPVGFAISTAYFVGNVAYEYYNGKTVGEELQEWVD